MKNRIEDLKDRLLNGELTLKQAKEILHERGLSEVETWRWGVYVYTVWAAYFILWLLPSWSQLLRLEFLDFFVQLPAFGFPVTVIYISVAVLAIDIVFAVWMHLSHVKWGGLRESGETLIFYRKGPFIFMRHPGVFSFMVGFVFLPIALSWVATFTLLTVAAIIIFLAFNYHYTLCEEKMNLKKWGDEYQRYMKEVPRFNFILGLRRLRKKPR